MDGMKPLSSLVRRRRMVVTIDGAPFTGKTHFALTMPQPLCVFSIDQGLEGVVEDMESEGYDFSGVEFSDFSMNKPPSGSQEAIPFAQAMIKRFHASFRAVMQRKTPTSIALDTGTEFWEQFRLADLGKLEQVPPMRYTKINRLFKDLLNEVFNTPHSLCLIHHEKDLYDQQVTESGKEVSVRVPGQVVRQGFKGVEGIMQVVLRSRRIEKADGTIKMGFVVRKCRQRAAVTGQKYMGPLATFPNLALDVFPNSEPSDWGIE